VAPQEFSRDCFGCGRTLPRARFQVWHRGKRNGLHERCDDCRAQSRRPPVELVCPACGATFLAKASQQHFRVYCSVACKAANQAPPPKPRLKPVPHADAGPNPSGLCRCGCGGTTPLAKRTLRAPGNVAGLPLRYLVGHAPNKPRPEWLPVQMDPETGCWVWQGARYRTGYGCVRRSGRNLHAHRYTYEKANGPIPPGLELDHLCRNRACVNPDHLEPVTHAVNMQRSPRTKLCPADVAEIRRLYGDVPTKDLAVRFGVAYSTVVNVAVGRKWRDHAGTRSTTPSLERSTRPPKIQ
jgi:hypothetical protein